MPFDSHDAIEYFVVLQPTDGSLSAKTRAEQQVNIGLWAMITGEPKTCISSPAGLSSAMVGTAELLQRQWSAQNVRRNVAVECLPPAHMQTTPQRLDTFWGDWILEARRQHHCAMNQ